MGYSTDFHGKLEIEPPLNEAEIAFLTRFFDADQSRDRQWGNSDLPEYIDFTPPDYSNYCDLTVTVDGKYLQWNGSEKTYQLEQWVQIVIDHFLSPNAKAKEKFPLLEANHIVNGTLLAQGEDIKDRWKLVVTNNVVTTLQLE